MAEPVGVTFSVASGAGSAFTYSYGVTGSFAAGDDLAIYFPVGTASAIAYTGAASADWSTLILQPDANLGAPGEFDLIATVDGPDLSLLFPVSFLAAGTALPGAQAFTVFDASFNVLATGTTQAVNAATVPEPGSLLLLGSGALGAWSLRRRLR